MLVACGATEPELCEDGIDIGHHSCLIFDEALSPAVRERVEATARTANAAVNEVMSLSEVELRVVSGPEGAIRELGIGGYAPGPDVVFLYVDEGSPALDASLEHALLPLIAHEMHHTRRSRTIGYGSTLLEAMISEGLADHFGREVAGTAAPPWSLALAGDELAHWSAEARDAWHAADYDHPRWFFGTADVPRWAGYTLGYGLVAAYLEARPGSRPSQLFAAPAADFASGS